MKKLLKKKRFLYPLILIGQIMIVAIVAAVFDLETYNSVLGVIYTYTLLITLICFVVVIIRDHKVTLFNIKVPYFEIPIVLWLLYLTLVMLVIFALIFVIVDIFRIMQVFT